MTAGLFELQWVVQLHDSSNVALLAGITTLGLVTMSVMVACGLAAWLCGVGLRTARGQGDRARELETVRKGHYAPGAGPRGGRKREERERVPG